MRTATRQFPTPSIAAVGAQNRPELLLLVRPLSRSSRVAKRGMDLLLAVPCIIVLSPMMAIIAILVRVDSPGPALFRQERLTTRERTFRFVKFRTMHVDARERHPELYAYDFDPDALDDLVFKGDGDPRVTRMGRVLRRLSLDELPNLFNVLTGDLSLVGPRPEIPQMLRYHLGDERAKFAVKPGVTGLAQVSGRNALRWRETLALDLEYARCRSIWLDLKILARTPIVVLQMLGAL